jgi:GntR family transcriptional regulator of gluconate operon
MLERVSLPEAVARALRHRILNNDIAAETRLVEANLAADFGVSRGTVRDAMRSLQAEGLIEIVPHRYSVVTRMSARDAEDICYSRYVLEDGSLRQGLQHPGLVLAAGLKAAMADMAQAAADDDLDTLVASDIQFHRQLVELSGRRRLKQLWSILDSQIGAVLRAEIERRGTGLDGVVQRHTELAQALLAGDSEQARAALKDHYLDGYGGYGSVRIS